MSDELTITISPDETVIEFVQPGAPAALVIETESLDVSFPLTEEIALPTLPEAALVLIYGGGQVPGQTVIIPGPSGTEEVEGETPMGVIDGSNATFVSQFDFIPESVEVEINGLGQRRILDFNTSGTRLIIFSESPQAGDSVRIDYVRI